KVKEGTEKPLSELTSDYDFVFFSSVNKKFAKEKFVPFLPVPEGLKTPIVALPWSADNPLLNALSADQADNISRYYRNGGAVNMSRLGDYLNAEIFKLNNSAVLPPLDYPNQGIYHPDYEDKIFPDLKSYLQWKNITEPPSDQPVIGIMMRLAHFGAGKNNVVDSLIKKLENKGAFVIPFYIAEYKTDYTPLIMQNDRVVVNNLINLRTMHAANKRAKQFEKLGVPVLHAIQYYDGDAEFWRGDAQGVSPMMTPFMLSMPETAGVIDITTVAASPRGTEVIELLDEQIDAIVQRSLNQANLVFKPNADKKLTMMVWNYPAGEKNITASFMNIPDSIEQITLALKDDGYQVEVAEKKKLLEDVNKILRPFYRDYKLTSLLDDGLAELMPVATYNTFLNTLPEATRDAIEKDWGKAEKAFMVIERDGKKYFVIPRIKLGNLIIMRQPPRGDQNDKEKSLYHDKTITVNHYYLAAYLYARKVFGSDALIHLGTHGSQEYLPGKERSLSVYDGAALAVGDTPVVYPFIIDDVGEAVQAKRRGRAVIISHMTPPFAAAGLYAESMDLHELMHQYNSMVEGRAKKLTLEKITDICVQNAYCKDIDWGVEKIEKNPKAFLSALHDYLGELASESQPLGLHSFGQSPEEEHIISSLIQMLGTDFSDRAINIEAKMFDSDKAHSHQNEHSQDPTLHSHDDTAHSHTPDSHQHEQGHDATERSHNENDHDHDEDEHRHNAKEDSHGHEHEDGTSDHRHEPEHDATEHSRDHQDSALPASSGTEDIPERGEDIRSIPGFKLLAHYLSGDGEIESLRDKAMKAHVIKAKEYYDNFHQLAELSSMLDALSGKYIKVTTGGDPVRNPEVVPTGFNLYGFDPAKVPTKAAWEAGSELTEKLIADHYQQHGKYPEKMAFSLWSIETMRHFGVLEAQVLRAMGVRPIWSDDGRVTDTEIIPYSELKRPRVDVVLSATGLYRDAFPNVIEWMAEAIAKVARLKEEGNTLYKHAQATQAELEKEGLDAEQAEYLSTVRIFSNKSGTYGSGLGGTVMESGTWDKDDKLAKVYLDRMGYYFGPKQGKGRGNQKNWGKKIDNVDLYGKTLSGTDVAVFSRTSNLYGLLTSDDPFQYLGGLSLAVRHLDGESPQLYISNLRDANNSRTETIQKFMAKELRNRSFHPRWIEEMKEEGYSGALAMLDNLNNFWGWQVTAPESVREDQWQEFFEVYIEDKYEFELDEWFEQANNHSKAQMLERMLEAVRKDYWQADPETLKKMVSEYVKQASQFDYKTSNEKFVEYVTASAQGYGLDTSAISVPPPPGTNVQPPEMNPADQPQAEGKPAENVTGVKLEKTEATTTEQEWNYQILALTLFMLLIFVAGMGRRLRRT
ncbi:MAG TPA: hypothetical protein DD827_05560, partial [Gammaproteobacteria bacterium]|nr:hypothetical protein [Gammaproteobacteria bacterium]